MLTVFQTEKRTLRTQIDNVKLVMCVLKYVLATDILDARTIYRLCRIGETDSRFTYVVANLYKP